MEYLHYAINKCSNVFFFYKHLQKSERRIVTLSDLYLLRTDYSLQTICIIPI